MKTPRWPAWAVGPAVFAGAWGVLLALRYRSGGAKWKTWEHPVPGGWSWSGFIHPPFFSIHQETLERWARPLDLTAGELLAFVAPGLAVLVVLLTAWCVGREARQEASGSPAWAGLAAAFLAWSPTGLRPYEQYPASRFAVALAVALVLHYALRGGLLRALAAFVACALALQVHLSAWFVLGPLLVLLTVPLPKRRRGLGLVTLALLLTFWASIGPNPLYQNELLDVLQQPDVANKTIFTRPSFLNPTFELSNRWLFYPLVLWLVPGLRRIEPRGLPLAVATGLFVAVHLGLQRRGLVLHAQAPEPHHLSLIHI